MSKVHSNQTGSREIINELINEFWKCTKYDFTDPVLIEDSEYFKNIIHYLTERRNS